jgi:hypothetical protein
MDRTGYRHCRLPVIQIVVAHRKDIWTLDGDTIRWFGVALFAAGGALRLWPVFVLGRRFSPNFTPIFDEMIEIARGFLRALTTGRA